MFVLRAAWLHCTINNERMYVILESACGFPRSLESPPGDFRSVRTYRGNTRPLAERFESRELSPVDACPVREVIMLAEGARELRQP